MDYSQWQQPPAPAMQAAEMNQSAVDGYYASYYAYYAPSLNQNPNSTSHLQTHESSSAIAIPPPPGVVVDAYSSAAASNVTVDTTPYYTLDTNAQSLAWRDAVRMYGTDPLAITDAVCCFSSFHKSETFSCSLQFGINGSKVMFFMDV